MEKLCVIFSVLISVSNSQLLFATGESSVVNNKSKDRQPVYVPNQCGPNEWLWPVPNTEEGWSCDCANRFVIHKPTDRCYELYRQGPCQKGEYFIIPKGKNIAECVSNPCKNDTVVPFNGKCHVLYKTDACVKKGGGTLNINLTSLEVDCLPPSAAELNIITVGSACPPGSRRQGASCRRTVG